MLRYRDSGPIDDIACPGGWFDETVVAGIRGFRGQFGFFRFGALRKYARVLSTTAIAGYPVNLVLGSNPTDRLTVEDVRAVRAILGPGAAASLTIVALQNALFHPKVAHVICADGSAKALVGSPNLTELALGTHVEAWIELASGPDVNPLLEDIVRAIDRWSTLDQVGVFQIRSDADIGSLLASEVLITQADRRRSRIAVIPDRGNRRVTRGTRRARWRPPRSAAPQEIENEQEIGYTETEATLAEPPSQLTQAASAQSPSRASAPRVVFRWSKRLSRSDVNKNPENERNLLSLGVGRGQKARVMDDIDDIRNKMMADANWDPIQIRGAEAESAVVPIRVKFPRRAANSHTLEVVHAPHRGSGQHNYHTSIRWDAPISRFLRTRPDSGFAGYWATLEKYDNGEYSLTITKARPVPLTIGLRTAAS